MQDEALPVSIANLQILAQAQGVEEGLAIAADLLAGFAETMLQREDTANPGAKVNRARRVRIKAYQVAGGRIATRLSRQRRLLAKLETAADDNSGTLQLKAAVEDLAL
jgi:hypothetical protein